MNLFPPDRTDFLCPSTQEQFKRLLSIDNLALRVDARSLDKEDPGNSRFVRRPRKLRDTIHLEPTNTLPVSQKRHATEDCHKTRFKRIATTASAHLTIQPTSTENTAFLDELLKDADKCLDYGEWFARYKSEMIERYITKKGECEDEMRRNVMRILNVVSIGCHLEASASLYQKDTVADRWHVPSSLSVVGRPMTRSHLKLALCFKWRGVQNPMQLRRCLGWQGSCLVDTVHGQRPFELPPYRALTDYLENNDCSKHESQWHWGQPMCLVCRISSMHFPLLTRKGRDVKGCDFSMYHDLDFVDVLPKYVIQIPRPCREMESGVTIPTQTLLVLSFTQNLRLTEDGYDISRVCRAPVSALS